MYRGGRTPKTLGLSSLIGSRKRRSNYRKKAKKVTRAYNKGRQDMRRGVKFTQAPYYRDALMEQEWKRGWEEECQQRNQNQ